MHASVDHFSASTSVRIDEAHRNTAKCKQWVGWGAVTTCAARRFGRCLFGPRSLLSILKHAAFHFLVFWYCTATGGLVIDMSNSEAVCTIVDLGMFAIGLAVLVSSWEEKSGPISCLLMARRPQRPDACPSRRYKQLVRRRGPPRPGRRRGPKRSLRAPDRRHGVVDEMRSPTVATTVAASTPDLIVPWPTGAAGPVTRDKCE